MNSEERIVELLPKMLIKQEAFVEGLLALKVELSESKRIQIRKENHLIKLLEILTDDVPKFDQVIELEELKGVNIIPKRTHA
ncbi:MAG: hypothetical protein GY816_09280 [Cytophagales bacterium]|nr:hypothetical protein [Cytophagales bacterium]